MSAPTATRPPTAWDVPFVWADDVLAYARRFGVEAGLSPFLEATRRLFPTALRLVVSLRPDPEIPDYTFFVFELDVPLADHPDYLVADGAWHDEFDRAFPEPTATLCPFALLLHRVGDDPT